ncbi:MAG: hypothetical protein M3349_00395 [Actinomycetota bacterium]|nr:hypothetical protein [Actinomycetota bacterium]
MVAKTDIWATSQAQLTDFYRSSQDALVTGVETWAKAVRQLADAANLPQHPTTIGATIDQAFATASAALDEQRQFVKRLVAAATPTDG